MIQQSHSQAYTLRKPKLKKTHVSHCSLQHYLQQLEHGSNLDVHRQMDKEVVVHIHNGILLINIIKRNTFESVLMRWMNLEPIIQNEMSQKDKYHILTHIYGIQKNGTEEFIYRAAMEKWDLPDPGIEPRSPTLQADALTSEPPGKL